jgi:Ras homolog enriched in brain
MKDGRIRFDLDIVDTAGQDEFSRIPSEASLGVHGYVLVYDVTSRTSFDQLKVINDRLLEAIGADRAPRVVVANKCDLKSAE